MIDIDDLLSGAAERLDAATSMIDVPAAPAAGRTPGRGVVAVGVAIAAAAAVAAAAIGVSHRDADEARALPPGFADGEYGTEIVLSEVDDGDGDPATITYEADHDAGRVFVSFGAPVGIADTAPAVPGDQTGPDDPTSTVPMWCFNLADGAGTGCTGGQPPADVQIAVGERADTGQAAAYGLPDEVVAVTFRSGSVRFWARPLDGIVVFPRRTDQGDEVLMELIGSDGEVLTTTGSRSEALSDAEIAAAAVTIETGTSIDDGYFADLPEFSDAVVDMEVVRRRGRTSSTGFEGPYAAQSIQLTTSRNEDPLDTTAWVVTVLTTDLDDAERRIDQTPAGSIRATVQMPSGGVSVIVWAPEGTSDERVDSIVEHLVKRPPNDRNGVLDRPTSWNSERQPLPVYSTDAVITSLRGTHFLATDPFELWAVADDVGAVLFMARRPDGSLFSTLAGGPTDWFAASPISTGQVLVGLWAVPDDVTGAVITRADGTTVDALIVDVGAYAPAKLVYVPDDIGPVTGVELRRG